MLLQSPPLCPTSRASLEDRLKLEESSGTVSMADTAVGSKQVKFTLKKVSDTVMHDTTPPQARLFIPAGPYLLPNGFSLHWATERENVYNFVYVPH